MPSLEPAFNLFLHDFSFAAVFLLGPSDDEISSIPGRCNRRQLFAKKRLPIQQSGAQFKIVKPREMRPCMAAAELAFKHRGVRFTYAEGEKRADIAENSVSDFIVQLAEVL